MLRANEDLRQKIAESGIRQWQIAEWLNMTESALTRALRHVLEAAEKDKILKAIRAIKAVQ